MNKVILMGRLTRDPEVRYSEADEPMAVARFILAVNRKFAKKDAEQSADFIQCIASGKNGEFIEKYFRQGMRVLICGRIQTGSYTNRYGTKVYTTNVIVEEQNFAESKKESENDFSGSEHRQNRSDLNENGFMNIPEGIDADNPFN